MSGVTALGSLPGTDAAAAVRLAFEAAPDLPWLPELPARGPWAGIVGRSCALLSGLSVEFAAHEWTLSGAPGVDHRRARATLRDDLDVLEEYAHDYAGPFKVQVAGPWTLASSVFLPRGGRVLGDRGARRDLAQSLAAGVEEHLADVRSRLTASDVRLQVDEPSLPAALAGRVPTEGGYFRHRPVSDQEAAETLAPFSGLTAASLVHCCAPDVPVGLLAERAPDGAGFAGVSLDASLDAPGDPVAAAVAAGTDLFWGAASRVEPPDAIARRVLDALRPLDLGDALADRLWLTPACGLAGMDPPDVPRLLAALRAASGQVQDALRA